MPLDPQIAVILESLNVTASLDLSTVSPAIMRQMFEQPGEARDRGGPELVHQLVRYDGMVHGFVLMGDAIDRAKKAVALVGRAPRDAFGNGL